MTKVWFGINDEGYEEISVPYNNETATVHQLLACANGEDPKKVWSGGEYVTHHEKPIPWLNTPDNLSVVTKAEHNRIHKPREKITKEMCESIRQRIKDTTLENLSEEYSVCISGIAKHVYGNCSHCDTPAVDKNKGPREGPWREKDVFEKLYCDEGLNLKEVGDRLGCSQAAASNWKRRHGL